MRLYKIAEALYMQRIDDVYNRLYNRTPLKIFIFKSHL